MSYRFRSREPVARGVRRLARQELDKAIAGLLDPEADRDGAVHDARKRTKKVRALLRLVRDHLGEETYRRENGALREASNSISGLRDSRVRVATVERLSERIGPGTDLGALRDALDREHQEELAAARREEQQVPAAIESLRRVWNRVEEWPLPGGDFSLAQAGLEKAYKKGRKRFRQAYRQLTPEAFHAWRKRVKDLWYHVRLLEPAWPHVLGPLAGSLHQLSDHLGDLHDVDELEAYLEDHEELADWNATLGGPAEAAREELADKARHLARRLYADSPGGFTRRMERIWNAWRAETARDEEDQDSGSSKAERKASSKELLSAG